MDVKTGVRVFTKVTLLCLIVGGEGGGRVRISRGVGVPEKYLKMGGIIIK